MPSPGFCTTFRIALRWHDFVRVKPALQVELTTQLISRHCKQSEVSYSDCHAELRLGERHKCFKASFGCSVPVSFLVDQPDPRSLELEHKHTYIHKSKHSTKCSYSRNPFQQFLFVCLFCQTVCVEIRITENISMLFSTLKKFTSA